MKFKSKVDEIYDRLRSEGKLIILSDVEVATINEHVSRDMRAFRIELGRKQAQSEKDTHGIVLSRVHL